MAKREKKVIISGVTRESADEAFAIYAKADAQSMKIIADIELLHNFTICSRFMIA